MNKKKNFATIINPTKIEFEQNNEQKATTEPVNIEQEENKSRNKLTTTTTLFLHTFALNNQNENFSEAARQCKEQEEASQHSQIPTRVNGTQCLLLASAARKNFVFSKSGE